jgi:hypothetical protein
MTLKKGEKELCTVYSVYIRETVQNIYTELCNLRVILRAYESQAQALSQVTQTVLQFPNAIQI